MTFDEDLRQQELAAAKIHEAELRRQNLQYAGIAVGIFTFFILFSLLSHSVIVNIKLISFLGVLGLLMVFEFINLLLHPFLEKVTNHSPILMLLALVVIASLLIPFHHKLEKWIKVRMTEKNKEIKLAAAKKTIEELENNANINK
jgi:apolipoprotein N-acyltransferase